MIWPTCGVEWTRAFLIVLGILCLAWETFVLCKWGMNATISRVLMAWSADNPAIPFGLGLLWGHIFLRN
jgi:hypothetical protein